MCPSPLSARTLAALRCPACAGRLRVLESELLCESSGCERRYPVVGDVPVLIDDDTSVLRTEDYLHGEDRVLYSPRGTGAKSRLRGIAHQL